MLTSLDTTTTSQSQLQSVPENFSTWAKRKKEGSEDRKELLV